ncbi:MAG: adenosylcobinamide amidohydrolase [Candidatus Bathyarchaeia archaeon]
MEEIPLFNGVKALLSEKFLAVVSEAELCTVSSAIHNGGFKRAKILLNVHVSESQDMMELHRDPVKPILEVLKELEANPNEAVGMVTAADVREYSMKTLERNGLKVTAIATAGCSFAEKAGDDIESRILPNTGTINTIIVIQGNPTESCMMQSFIAATEAKTSALMELDVRSRYSGDLATGTITDSTIIAATSTGPPIHYGGPASRLGKLVSQCTKVAVKGAIMKNGNLNPSRSILQRLSERRIPIDDMLQWLLRSKSAYINLEEFKFHLSSVIEKKPILALFLMMAVKMDEDIKFGLKPKELGDLKILKMEFEEFLAEALNVESVQKGTCWCCDYPFLESVLSCIVEKIRNDLNCGKEEGGNERSP